LQENGSKKRRKLLNHPLSPLARNAALALLAVLFVMAVGTIGIKLLTGWRWVDSFYFMAMIGTAEGPPTNPPNFWSKIFAAVMAFVSIGTLISAVGVLFGPYLGYLFHKGAHFAENETKRLEAEERGEAKKEKE
jgi:hypothetical protein